MELKTILKKYKDFNTHNENIKLLSEIIKCGVKYEKDDSESIFVINILTKNTKYSSYISEIISQIEEYIECNIYLPDDCKFELEDEEYIETFISDICLNDIEKIIRIFKEKQLPAIEIDSVIDELGSIFEKVIGENHGYIRDEHGKFNKFGEDNEKYTELLGIKYPWFKEIVCDNEDKKENFIKFLDSITDKDIIHKYDEIELVEGWE